jgi:serine/threonine-protein kinase
MPASAVTDRIGSYRVIRHLSVTGSVSVHLAREDGPLNASRTVVLKIVPRVTGEGAQDIEELTRDATECAKLTHPGIVRIRHFFPHDDALVLVVEHVEGFSLAALLARQEKKDTKFFSDDAVRQIGVCICDALAHAHALEEEARPSIVHRAVNPSNVLIGRDGAAKLDGFGFARILGGVATDPSGSLGWTPAYMAPEQVTDQPATHKTDVYAAGLILWELFAGRPPVPFPNNPYAIDETLRAVAERKPPSLATARPDLPQALVRAVDGALVSTVAERTVSCADLARALRQVGSLEAGKRELRELVIRAHAELTAPSYRMRTAHHGTLQGVAPQAAKPGASPAPTAAKRSSIPAAPLPVEEDVSWIPPEPMPERNVPRLAEVLSSPPMAMAPEAYPDPSPYEPTFVKRSSLGSRLRAPTPWRRVPMLVAWASLTLGLAAAVAFVASSRRSKAPASAASQPVRASPEPAPTPTPATTNANEPPAVSAAPSAEPAADDISESLKQRGLGYLTVHSSAAHATVYVNLKPRGKPDEKLTVQCGNRFVSIGVPNGTAEPAWLAPGKTMVVPCGGSLEMTMDPRALRVRGE